MIEQVYRVVEEVRRQVAPDLRTAVFEIDVARDDSTLVFFGACSVPSAVEALRAGIAGLELGLEVRDEIRRLPVEEPGAPPHALITSATAPMLAGPLISESHLSQVLLGHRVTVLREHGRWLQCRSTDGYLGWIHRGYLRRVSETEARSWDLGVDGELHVSLGAEALTRSGEVAAKLPWGARVALDGRVATMPDGSEATVRGRLIAACELSIQFPTEGRAIVRTAEEWRGTPYLWGGVTPAGVDCSGLVQAVYRMHGMDLPRDSDQQARRGEELPIDRGLDALEPGDLLFFAELKDRISHVAISMGGSRIIHSAVGTGGVSVNDLDAATGYDTELRQLLVTARRIVSSGS